MKNIKNTSAFTLIEMIVVMTILAILAVGSYGNYLLYQKKEMIRQAQREISKTIIEARNMAINGYDSIDTSTGDNINKDIGIEIIPYSGSGDFISTINICSFDAIGEDSSITATSCSSGNIVQSRDLPKNIIVQEIQGSESLPFFGYFKAVTGSEKYEPSGTDSINFKVSYANSTGYLTGCVEYYTKGHTSDFTKCI